jgi:hypothetical protein
MTVWRSCWTAYGFSPPSRSNGRQRGCRRLGDGPLVERRGGDLLRAARAAAPARRPNTSRSDSELPPSRFEPCIPPATSPAAYSPGTTAAAVSGLDLHPAHDVVAGRPDLHRLRGDVDLGQLPELVVHRRQALADVVGVAP